MANRLRALDESARRLRRDLLELIGDLREARIAAGLTQSAVARMLGWSRSKLSRIERVQDPSVSAVDLTRLAAIVGRRLSLKLYPGQGRLRDEAQVALESRFLKLINGWSVLAEDAIPLRGDLRAFDITLRGPVSVGLEFLTRLRDLQAQVRSAIQKKRDSRVDRAILVIGSSHANRRAAREAGAVLAITFPVRTREVLTALRHGRDPGGDATIFL